MIVMLQPPSAEEKSRSPSGPWTENDRTWSALVRARLTNDAPDSRSSRPPLAHARSIDAGGGAHTALSRVESVTVCATSPDRANVAAPAESGLSGAGDSLALGDDVAVVLPSTTEGVGGEIDGSTSPVTVHAVANAAIAATSIALRIAPSLPRPWSVGRTIRTVAHPARARPSGSVPALLAAWIAFVTAIVYVVLIVLQEEGDVLATALVTAWIVGLGSCALVGGLRTTPDRVIPLGAAVGGLFGAAVLSLFSIGALLLIAGFCALIAWIRAGVEASASQNQLGALAGIGAALGFLAIVFVF